MTDILLTRRISRRFHQGDVVEGIDLTNDDFWLSHVLAGNAIEIPEASDAGLDDEDAPQVTRWYASEEEE